MAATVDVGYLAASYSVPETTLHSLLSEPTVELVQSLLTQIEAKARAYDDLQSDKIRADVELEAAVQGGEQRARSLKATAEKAQKEAEELKKKLVQEGEGGNSRTRFVDTNWTHQKMLGRRHRRHCRTYRPRPPARHPRHRHSSRASRRLSPITAMPLPCTRPRQLPMTVWPRSSRSNTKSPLSCVSRCLHLRRRTSRSRVLLPM